MLNMRRPLDKDFRGLAKLMGYTEDEIEEFDLVNNPTCTNLVDWRSQKKRTVDELIRLLKSIKRCDVIQILSGTSVFGYRKIPY